MEKKTDRRGPVVRIGVIQSIETVELSVNQNAQIINQENKVVGTVHSAQQIKLVPRGFQSGNLDYYIRIARLPEKKSAELIISKLKIDGIQSEIQLVGEVLEFEKYTMDNREYWVLVGPYKSFADANEKVTLFQDFSDQTVLKIPSQQPTGIISWDNQALGSIVRIIPDDIKSSRITISNVRVGIEFHWDRLESQDYRGIIEVCFNDEGKLIVINEISIEDYLTSVNSSEMTPDCPMDLLKSQTVAARSTIFATMGKHHFGQPFHLCADDHCQCYRGTRYEQEKSAQAVNECAGEVLLFDGRVCDARYAKICGGVMESFENVWEDYHVPYLVAGIDGEFKIDLPVNTEERAKAYIDANPDAYCNTDKYELPKMLAYANHLFRWKIEYSRVELEEIIRQRTGHDLGELQEIRPLKRGDSGRLMYIELVGSKKTVKIGKELAIRRALSKTHLYSACFYVETKNQDGQVTHFILKGAGWGHGVGYCQVGATVMAQKGFSYQKILAHYFKQSELIRLY
ncbi:SpoIID/LytB domain-containing protein [candidate division KSB1 bacterium]|nr:SpoIID/LytB domain-containing protein [candidate division KSB1 bacterium]